MNYRKGFTLIEIIVVIGIFTAIIAFGMTVDLSVFTRGTFQGEESKIVSALERARSRAMANMFDASHGVCYDPGADSYVIFQGSTCNAGAIASELVPANTNIAENSGTIFPTVVFNQLSGTTTNASLITITITDGVKSKNITINNEGTINW